MAALLLVGPKPTPIGLRLPTTGELREPLLKERVASLNAMSDYVRAHIRTVPLLFRGLAVDAYAWGVRTWFVAHDAARAAYVLNAASLAVYLAWKIPRARPLMRRHFVHDPYSGKVYTMLTSLISHRKFIPLAVNVTLLTSFASAAAPWLILNARVPEASETPHFMAFYLSAGLFAALTSHLAHARLLYPRLARRLATSAAPPPPAARVPWRTRLDVLWHGPVDAAERARLRPPQVPPVNDERDVRGTRGGAGALYALAALVAWGFDDAEVSFSFLPDVTLSMSAALGGAVLLNVVGAVRGWRWMGDHFAHVGGAAFGAVYASYGARWWAWWRGDVKPSEILGEIVRRRKETAAEREEAEGRGQEEDRAKVEKKNEDDDGMEGEEEGDARDEGGKKGGGDA